MCRLRIISSKKKKGSVAVDVEQEATAVTSDVQSEEDTQLKRRHGSSLPCFVVIQLVIM